MVDERTSQEVPTRQEIADLLEKARRRDAGPGLPRDMHGVDLRGLDLGTATPAGPWRLSADLRGADLRGADLWNADLSGANLHGANLHGANLMVADIRRANLTDANLTDANLGVADLSDADLTDANLRRANLSGATLRVAKLHGADLSQADIRRAYLWEADLTDANLRGADLSEADLHGANLRRANLSGADFTRCRLGSANLSNIDLSGIRNLASVLHSGPTEIGTNTLELTAAGLTTQPGSQRDEVFDFLRKAGVRNDLLTLVRSWIGNPIEFYSSFISYSHADKEFARLLYDTLQDRGIRCWLDEHQLLPGDNIYDAVDRGIRLWDKVLLCCSQAALKSWWVDNELEKAFVKERRLQKERGRKLELVIPLDLDGYLFKWDDGKASKLQERYAPLFTGWEGDAKLFGKQVDQVIKALRSDAGARDQPPSPKL